MGQLNPYNDIADLFDEDAYTFEEAEVSQDEAKLGRMGFVDGQFCAGYEDLGSMGWSSL